MKYVDLIMNITGYGDIVFRYTESTDTFSELVDTAGIASINLALSDVYTSIYPEHRTVGFIWTITTGATPQNNNGYFRAIDDDNNIVLSSTVEFDFISSSTESSGLSAVSESANDNGQYQNNGWIFHEAQDNLPSYDRYQDFFNCTLEMVVGHSINYEYLEYLRITFNTTTPAQNSTMYQELYESDLVLGRVWNGDYMELKSNIYTEPYYKSSSGTFWKSENDLADVVTVINSTHIQVRIEDIYLFNMTRNTITCSIEAVDVWGFTSTTQSVTFDVGDSFTEVPIIDISQLDIERAGDNITAINDMKDVGVTFGEDLVWINLTMKDDDSYQTTENIPATDELNENNVQHGLIIWLNGTQVYNSFNITDPTDYSQIGSTKLYRADGTRVLDEEWIYEGEIYKLSTSAQYPHKFYVNFSDTQRTISFHYENKTGVQMWIEANDGTEFTVGEIASIYRDNITKVGMGSGWHEFNWTFTLGRSIVDSTNVEFNVQNNSTWILASGFVINQYDVLTVNIYNLGGLVSYSLTNGLLGGHIEGGEPFELWVESGGVGGWTESKAEVIYDKLQHIHMLVELNSNFTWNGFTGRYDYPQSGLSGVLWEYRLDYEVDEEWVNGWKVRIQSDDKKVGHQNGGLNYNFVTWNITMWQYDSGTSNWIQMKQGFVTTNNWGYDHDDAEPTHHDERTTSQLWVDLWFNNMNASTVVGARVSPYYYGYYEQGSVWWFGIGSMRPIQGNSTVVQSHFDLLDGNGDRMNSYEINRVKASASIYGTGLLNNYYDMRVYEVFNLKLADDRMRGIDTPPIISPRELTYPANTFLTPLIKAIESIGTFVWRGVFTVIRELMGSVDTFLSYLGLPPVMQVIISYITMMYNVFIPIWNNASLLIGSFVDIIVNMVMPLVQLVPRYLYLMYMIYDVVFQIYNGVIGIFTGNWLFFSFDFWNQINMRELLELYFIAIFPFWWLDRVDSAKDSVKQASEDIGAFVNASVGLAQLIYWLLSLVTDLISRIREMLPF